MDEKITRREFLKLGALATASVMLTGCEFFIPGKKSEFTDILPYTVLPFKIGGNYLEPENVIIVTQGLKTPPVARFNPDNKNWQLYKFVPGPRIEERRLGEIVDNSLRRVEVNRDLVGIHTVGVYPKPDGYSENMLDGQNFPEGKEIYGMPVITTPLDAIGDSESKLPKETQPGPNGKEWGLGMLVGTIEVNNDKKTFVALGYVPDGRALKFVEK